MTVFRTCLSVCGGLALFLYAVRLLCSVPAPASFVRNAARPFPSFLYGFASSSLLQSSSASTVTTVSLVQSGAIPLSAAVFAVMGANLGSTVTGLLLSVRFSLISPLFSLVGVLLFLYGKSQKLHRLGSFLTGIGFLFIGTDLLSDAVRPFLEATPFLRVFLSSATPFSLYFCGLVVTALLQSSAASLSILLPLAGSVIPLSLTPFFLLGMNVGTCVTAFLASVASSDDAKRVAFLHLTFNVVASVTLFLPLFYLPVTAVFSRVAPPKTVVALVNVCINAIAVLLCLPLSKPLVALSRFLIKKDRSPSGKRSRVSIEKRIIAENISRR